jgi:voltage-gated potassium channel
MWWGIVTLTTVGYGDVVPITEKGRIAGTALMLTGIATLGLISGTLASAFGGHHAEATPPEPQEPPAPPAVPTDLVAELAAVRDELAGLQQRLAAITDVASETIP